MSCIKIVKNVSHVIFDMDGVLLDTEHLYTKATQNIVGQYGKTYDWSIKTQLMGLTGTESAQKIVKLLDLPITPEEYYKKAQEEYALVMKETNLMPGNYWIFFFTDTEIVYKNAIQSIASRFGKVYTPYIMAKVIGTPERESSRIAVQEMKLPISVDDFQTEFRTRAHSLFKSTVPIMPGAAKLVKHLHENKIPIAVATSSSQESFDLKTAQHKHIFELFNHIVCGGSDPEVKKGKPNPDIFLVCASRFPDDPSAEKCLVFEDAPNGVTAARKAGMQVIMVPDVNVPYELRLEAHVVVNSIEEAPLQLFGLPPMHD